MRSTSPLLLSILVLMGCTNTQQQESVETGKKSAKVSFAHVLNDFESLKFDTLPVYSDIESSTFPFEGEALDTAYYKLFGFDAQHFLGEEPQLFACGKFDIGMNHVALIARVPSEYVPSSIRLYVLDRKTNKLSSQFELAESWGDAGDVTIKDSWLYLNANKQLEWLYQRQDCSYEGKNGEEYTCSDSLGHFVIEKGKIKALPVDSLAVKAIKRWGKK